MLGVFLLAWYAYSSKSNGTAGDAVILSAGPADDDGGSHALDPNHPDYGAIVIITLQENAGKKIVFGSRDLMSWYRSLTTNERDAVLLVKVEAVFVEECAAVLLEDGFDTELPRLISLLRNDIATPTALAVADELGALIPLVGRYNVVMPDDSDEAMEQHSAQLQVAIDVGKRLFPYKHAITRDIKHYMYRRWKAQGEEAFFGKRN